MLETTFQKTKRLAKEHRPDSFASARKKEMKSLDPFFEYLKNLRQDKNKKIADVCRDGDVDVYYTYQIFSGLKYPSRDVIIKLAFGFGLDVDETQELLKAAREATFNGKNDRDAWIIYGLVHGNSIGEVNELLGKKMFLELGYEKEGGRYYVKPAKPAEANSEQICPAETNRPL